VAVAVDGCVSRKCPDGEDLVDGKCVADDADAMADENDGSVELNGRRGDSGQSADASGALLDAGSADRGVRIEDGGMQGAKAVAGDAGSNCPFPVSACWSDADGDGYAVSKSKRKDVCGVCPEGSTPIEPAGDAVDCKDDDPDVYPRRCWPDADKDGYPADVDDAVRVCASKCTKEFTTAEPVNGTADCDDVSEDVHPSAMESCNGEDDDCDKATDEDADPTCSLAHGTGVCVKGKCAIKTCKEGYDDCDEDVENGCEQTLDTEEHCGACRNVCDGAASCEGKGVGQCVCHPPSFGDGITCQGLGPLSAGYQWSCAVEPNDDAACWGQYTLDSQVATAGYRQVAGAWLLFGFCGLELDGDITCTNGSVATAAFSHLDESFLQVVMGTDFACGLTSDLEAVCSGLTAQNTTVTQGGPYTMLAAGSTHACGLREDDSTVECWGDPVASSSNVCPGASCPQATPPSGKFVQIAAGGQTSCALTQDGQVTCWGNGKTNSGQDFDYGQAVPPTTAMSWISVGAAHACGIRADNHKAVCWGAGKPGNNRTYDRGQASPPSDQTFVMLSAGGFHTCGLTTSQKIVCWGDNAQHQCDAPDGEFPLTPSADD
jgi:hypothetical protein